MFDEMCGCGCVDCAECASVGYIVLDDGLNVRYVAEYDEGEVDYSVALLDADDEMLDLPF